MNCPHCQTANPEGARFCLNCGNQLEAPARVEGERKYVTVLFADVVDSTGLGGAARSRTVRGDHERRVRLSSTPRSPNTVGRSRGCLGDAILAFSARRSHTKTTRKGPCVPVWISRQEAREYAQVTRRDYGVDFNVRVGINTGLAVLAAMGDEIRTEYTAMGDTTNVAARMQSAALPGTVLISADTYHLVKELFEFKARGATEVRGKSAPIETYEVLAPKAVPGKVRGLEGEGLSSPLVGRAAEFRLVPDKVEEVREGRGAFVAVVGEAGLGKSRLLAEVRKLQANDHEIPNHRSSLARGAGALLRAGRHLLSLAAGDPPGDRRAGRRGARGRA